MSIRSGRVRVNVARTTSCGELRARSLDARCQTGSRRSSSRHWWTKMIETPDPSDMAAMRNVTEALELVCLRRAEVEATHVMRKCVPSGDSTPFSLRQQALRVRGHDCGIGTRRRLSCAHSLKRRRKSAMERSRCWRRSRPRRHGSERVRKRRRLRPRSAISCSSLCKPPRTSCTQLSRKDGSRW